MTNKQRARLVVAHDKALDKGKAAYQRAEEIFGRLMTDTAVGELITMPDKSQVVIIDQFAESNSAFKAARISRYVLKPVKATSTKPKSLVIERPQRGMRADIKVDEIADEIPGLER
jgi:hypothetical protein